MPKVVFHTPMPMPINITRFNNAVVVAVVVVMLMLLPSTVIIAWMSTQHFYRDFLPSTKVLP